MVLCGESCVDITSSEQHCGRCNFNCSATELCTAGVCGGDVNPPGIEVDPPVLVSGDSPDATCNLANETKPEHSINWVGGGISYFAGVQVDQQAGDNQGYYNWADNAGVWTSAQHLVTTDLESFGDPWTTTHGGTGLEYAAYIGIVPDPMASTWCAMVASTTPDLLAADTWISPAHCVSSPPSGVRHDGGTVYADLGAQTLYVSYTRIQGGDAFEFLRFWPCLGPVVGDADECPLDWVGNSGMVAAIQDHTNVVVNPCTHHPIGLFRTNSAAWYSIFDTNGNELQAVAFDTDAAHAGNTSCGPLGTACPSGGEICLCGGIEGECGDAEGCWNLTRRVHAATRYEPADQTCRMYLAYERSAQASDGETYMKARLRVFDITDESNIVEIGSPVDSAPDGDAHNDFGATTSANFFTPSVGFFFYRQEGGDPCTTVFRGLVSADGGDSFAAIPQPLSTPFPSIRSNFTDGLGHYVEAPRFTEPAGWLFPTWSQSILTVAECTPCLGQQYSVGTFGARVRP
jgi:hypothetical protein